ncbi:MAG: 2Fe-2S iron-sulfur cluster-binding protein [Candidatus Goldbacteria bacterium]|nr:2Fe-2S iron-sulfur cluster-binding protein [Candidatus Goldiibacteriota bacterium]
MSKIKLVINGKEVTANKGENILEVAQRNSIYIPRYCYHPALPIAGNCRICLVEIEKNPKLQIACATEVTDGMVIYAESEKVKKARQDVLEFLLINHPLDCPICDQVGECYLQEYYMNYGLRKSRINYEDKLKKTKRVDLGKIILDNERCILCTRCIRFLQEITKTNELFINSRGDNSFIDIKPNTTVNNNYSLNIVDICPVGALTSKDFRFKKRVYFLKTINSICLHCATGCKIKVQFDEAENKIYRILPDPNIYTNTWICDFGRFSYYETNNSAKYKLFNKEIEKNDVFLKYARFFSELIDSKMKICIILSNYLSLEDNISLYYLGTKLLETNYITFFKINERKIIDSILINSDSSPNSYGVEKIAERYKLKEFKNYDFDIVIGFEKEIKTLKIPPDKSVVISYKELDEYSNVIAIPTYFENEGSFINWQGYLRETKISVKGVDKIDLYSFIKKVMSLSSIYIEDKEKLKDSIKRDFIFKTEETNN